MGKETNFGDSYTNFAGDDDLNRDSRTDLGNSGG